jgi:uncharacterized membrane protein YagU involved in acid resistance
VRLGTAVIVLACIVAGLIGVVKYGPSKVKLPPKTTYVAELQKPAVERPPAPEVSACLAENWPNLSPECLKRVGRNDKIVAVRRVLP